MKRSNPMLMRGMLTFLVPLLAVNIASAADDFVIWDYDRMATETLDPWRFLAADSENAPAPTIERTRLAVVELPWQLERPRPMGYWLRSVDIPERFAGRDVFLEVETAGPTRVFVDGALLAERKNNGAGSLAVPIVRAPHSGGLFELLVSIRHGDGPARFIAARLVAEPSGFREFVQRREQLLRSFPALSADAANAPWRVKIDGPDKAAQPGFDDSNWEVGGKDYKWPDQYLHCWFRAQLVVPEEIAGRATKGKQLNLRAKFDDEGTVFLNGEELEVAPAPPGGIAFKVPLNVTPGEKVDVALRIFNKWGPGGLNALEWRFTELDEAERDIHRFETGMIPIDRVLRIHDRPQPKWIAALNKALDSLETGWRRLELLPEKALEALGALDDLNAMMSASPVIVLSPYLQDVRPDRVTVMWETSAPVNSYVEYGKKTLRRKAKDKGQANCIHEVVLTGLKPDTVYRYRVVSGDYATETFEVHTAPRKKRPFTFLVWGDNRSDPPMCEKVCLQMAQAQAELVLNVGDVVGRGSRWHEWTQHYLIPVRHWSHKWPSYVSIGNHEYGGSNESEGVPAFEQYLAHPTIVPGSNEYWYSFDYSNAHFLIIDGNRGKIVRGGENENDWTIDPNDPQLRWIEQDLKQAAGRSDWIFVFIHEPPYSEGWSGGYYDGEPPLRNSLVPILERYGVDIVFAGHTHDYERGLPHPPYDPVTGKGNNAVYIISGGGGSSLDNHKYYEWGQIDVPDHPADPNSDEPDEGQYYKYHYCWLKVDGKALSFEAREVLPDGRDGGVFDRFRLEK
ncbi:MAG: hypothetical protein GWP08_02645 [Nitrospiraceae bacterium]|nr:hypothetical protein [Nitrospiraceae bacterium]